MSKWKNLASTSTKKLKGERKIKKDPEDALTV
jgi:hypothetical protein